MCVYNLLCRQSLVFAMPRETPIHKITVLVVSLIDIPQLSGNRIPKWTQKGFLLIAIEDGVKRIAIGCPILHLIGRSCSREA